VGLLSPALDGLLVGSKPLECLHGKTGARLQIDAPDPGRQDLLAEPCPVVARSSRPELVTGRLVVVQVALVERVCHRRLTTERDRRGAASHRARGSPIRFSLELVPRSGVLAATAVLLHHVGELMGDEPVAIMSARLIGTLTEVDLFVSHERGRAPRREGAVAPEGD